jgi:hypothetical protein
MATDMNCTVSGGASNLAGDNDGTNTHDLYATVGGGFSNEATYWGDTILGGYNNAASGGGSFLGGGDNSVVSGNLSMAIGSRWCTASGIRSFAAGSLAKATGHGAFVWADASTSDPFTVSDTNRFGVRAQGGVYFYSQSNLLAGAYLPSNTGSWSSISDRNAKEDIKPVKPAEVLEKAACIPISTWRYKGEDPGIRHMGPMAQDVYAAFGLGDSDKGISTVDADGITLASIQALDQGTKDRGVRMNELEKEIERLSALARKLATK